MACAAISLLASEDITAQTAATEEAMLADMVSENLGCSQDSLSRSLHRCSSRDSLSRDSLSTRHNILSRI